jgi:XTP/dITP diphosphohydrolase
MKIVLASNNSGKAAELQAALRPFAIHLLLQADLGIQEVAETGCTFVENALLKARHAARISNLPAMSDDSGLVVAALHGAPGIYSARYAGKQANAAANNNKLLQALRDVPEAQRAAYFYCVLVLMMHADDPTPLICQGKWPGFILHEPCGNAGFGYDPIFYVPSEKKSAAELSIDKKNNISHRGIALQSLLTLLPEKLCTLSPSSN